VQNDSNAKRQSYARRPRNHTITQPRNHGQRLFICRLFNTAGQLNEPKLLTALLSQQLVALSEQQKCKIQEKLSDLLENAETLGQ
jgi:hypothetical protein